MKTEIIAIFADLRTLKITKETVIDTVATVSEESVLNIDEDGDGNYDLKLRADENGFGEEVKQVTVALYCYWVGSFSSWLFALVVSVRVCNKREEQKLELFQSTVETAGPN